MSTANGSTRATVMKRWRANARKLKRINDDRKATLAERAVIFRDARALDPPVALAELAEIADVTPMAISISASKHT